MIDEDALHDAVPALIAELRALRALRDEVEPVLRQALEYIRASMPEDGNWRKTTNVVTALHDILARHYDNKEPTK